jgi:EAL domain-containing protein (putative c-di-GMP-specific phosphodiesterase class I)
LTSSWLHLLKGWSLLKIRGDSLIEVLKQTGAPASQLKIELTESILIDDVDDATAKIRQLKELGFNFSIDDFGTGYSSLSYLMRLPIEQLKIDQSFIVHLPTEPRDCVVTKTIIDMAKNLGMHVIAEGVETEAQFQFLVDHGCPSFQGYLFSPALDVVTFEQFIDHQ